MSWWKFSLAMVVVPALLVAEEAVQLHYQADVPVLQKTRLVINIVDESSDEAHSGFFQEAEAELTLVPAETHPPYDLRFVFRRLGVGTEGETATAFDTNSSDDSPFLVELKKAIGVPVELTIDKNLQLTTDSESFAHLLGELSALKGFSIRNLVAEMFQQLFVLANQDLVVGSTISRQVKLGASPELITLEYNIVDITPSEIRITVKGQVPKLSQPLPATLLSNSDQPATLELSGTIAGKLVFDRRNALVYKTKIEHSYSGFVIQGTERSPMELQLIHTDSSHGIKE